MFKTLGRLIRGPCESRKPRRFARRPQTGRRRIEFEYLEERKLLSHDAFEVDDTPAQAKLIATNGSAQLHSLHNGQDVDYVKFTLTAPRNVTIVTNGVAGGDTEIRLYGPNNSGRRVPGGYDDDDGPSLYSKLTPSDTGALQAGTYWLRINEYGSNNAISSYSISVTASQNHARTPTGWYYPVQFPMPSSGDWPNGNWLFCGANYFTDLRHTGTDLRGALGTLVVSIGPGTVIARSTNGWGTGNVALAVRHSSTSGDFVAIYGHIRSTLTVGAHVDWATPLGTIGPWPNGDHVHFGILPGSSPPSGPWGRVVDVGCRNPGSTNGFVAPITWIHNVTPTAG